ncbi:MAG TPA: DNA gyrase inhibitor YacG [Bryobacteraceae bacterium]|nr:DNA gyrase inhibitor YacG [Bryobacteraceae bacterium]
MKCPICHKEVNRSNPDFPFCGERCRLIDLGNWASGKYVISSPLSPAEPFEEDKVSKEEHEE